MTFDRKSSLPTTLATIRTRPSNCVCQLTPESQTPLPLLENEYTNGFLPGTNNDENMVDNNRRVSAP